LHNKNIYLFLNQALILLSFYAFVTKHDASTKIIIYKYIHYEPEQVFGLMNSVHTIIYNFSYLSLILHIHFHCSTTLLYLK